MLFIIVSQLKFDFLNNPLVVRVHDVSHDNVVARFAHHLGHLDFIYVLLLLLDKLSGNLNIAPLLGFDAKVYSVCELI